MKKILFIYLVLFCIESSAQGTLDWYYDYYQSFVPPELELLSVSTGSSFCDIEADAEITSQGSHIVDERGFVYSVNTLPDINDSKSIRGSGIGSFSSTLDGSQESTTYYVRAYSLNNGIYTYSNQLNITTGITHTITASVGGITGTSADITVNATLNGNTVSLIRVYTRESGGIYSSTSELYPSFPYVTNLTGLNIGTDYDWYITTANGCDIVSTLEQTFSTVDYPVVSTDPTLIVGETTATLAGTVSSDGGGTISNRFFYWGLNSNPSSSDNVINGVTIGGTAQITGLTPGTTYYYRFGATNEVGTTTGGVQSLTTNTVAAPQYANAGSTTVASGFDSISIDMPSNISSGDLLVMVVTKGYLSTTDSYSTPSGWTKKANSESSTNLCSAMYTKTAGSSEPTSITVTCDGIEGSSPLMGAIYRYTNVSSTSGISGGSVGTGNSQTSVSSTIPSDERNVVINVFARNGTDYTPTNTGTYTWDSNKSTSTLLGARIVNSSASNGSFYYGWSTTSNLYYTNYYITLK